MWTHTHHHAIVNKYFYKGINPRDKINKNWVLIYILSVNVWQETLDLCLGNTNALTEVSVWLFCFTVYEEFDTNWLSKIKNQNNE